MCNGLVGTVAYSTSIYIFFSLLEQQQQLLLNIIYVVQKIGETN